MFINAKVVFLMYFIIIIQIQFSFSTLINPLNKTSSTRPPQVITWIILLTQFIYMGTF